MDMANIDPFESGISSIQRIIPPETSLSSLIGMIRSDSKEDKSSVYGDDAND
jgi:hypothetical protein